MTLGANETAHLTTTDIIGKTGIDIADQDIVLYRIRRLFIMKKSIYIDFNILTWYMNNKTENENVGKCLEKIKKKYDIYCSPAHFEEIAKIEREMKERKISKAVIRKHKRYLEELTNQNIVYIEPRTSYGKYVLKKNSGLFPQVYRDVIKKDGPNITRAVETIDKKNLEFWKEKRATANDPNKSENKFLNATLVSGISTKDIFESKAVAYICEKTSWDDYKEKISPKLLKNIYEIDVKRPYHIFSLHIECAMKILNYCGYHSDTGNLESPTHDISHAIYGAKCDYFITRDKKLFFRLKAVYFWLGVPTKVFLCKGK
ncbi:Uncharacterised protein [uncultured Ruminococcus sp.]|nr:Uncharacterised protein [uncultured Ruminococcus sp.]